MSAGINTHEESKKEIMDTYFFNVHSTLEDGSFQSISTVTTHLYPESKALIDYKYDNEYFRFVYEIRKTCNTKECTQYNKTITSLCDKSDGFFFHGDMDYTISINHMVQEELRTSRRVSKCVECKNPMGEENSIKNLPNVITIHLASKEFNFEIDNKIVLNGQYYELSSVIYFGLSHFITRSLVNGVAKEYNGMKQNGNFQILYQAHPFTYRITDLSTIPRTANTIFYRKINISK